MRSGVTHPRRERILRQFAAVGVDLAESTVRFIKDSQLFRSLENRERAIVEPAVWRSGGQTVGKRRTFSSTRVAPGHRRAGCRGDGFFAAFVIDEDVHEIFAMKVDVVAGGSQRTAGHVFAVESFDLARRWRFDLPDS